MRRVILENVVARQHLSGRGQHLADSQAIVLLSIGDARVAADFLEDEGGSRTAEGVSHGGG